MARSPKPPQPKHPPAHRPKVVREPIQVYLDRAERAILDRVADQTGLSRTEVLRRGLRRFAVEQQKGLGPMERFMRELAASEWPPGPSDLAINHDKYLAEIYMDTHEDAVPPRKPRGRRTR